MLEPPRWNAPQASPYREPFPRPLPPRPRYAVLAFLALGCLGLAAFTSHKLYVAAMLRGDIDGIAKRDLAVGHVIRRFEDGGEYSLYDPTKDHPLASWRIQLTAEQARRYHEQDVISVRCDVDERECYIPDSVFIDDGNRLFDVGLLVGELCGFAACLVGIIRRFFSFRDQIRELEIRKRS